jgi:hypothetical protein
VQQQSVSEAVLQCFAVQAGHAIPAPAAEAAAQVPDVSIARSSAAFFAEESVAVSAVRVQRVRLVEDPYPR